MAEHQNKNKHWIEVQTSTTTTCYSNSRTLCGCKMCLTITCIVQAHIYPSLVSVSCFRKEDDVDNKIQAEPNNIGQVVSQELQSHPVWDTLNPPPPEGLSMWLKPVCSTIQINTRISWTTIDSVLLVNNLPERKIFKQSRMIAEGSLKFLKGQRTTVCSISIFNQCFCQFIQLVITEVQSTFSHASFQHCAQVLKINMSISLRAMYDDDFT